LLEDGIELAKAKIEGVTSSNHADSERTQSELSPFRDLFGVVEFYGAAVDESNASFTYDLSNLSPHDDRGVFVDAEAHDFRILGDCDEQTIETPQLRKVRVDDCLEGQKSQARSDVLLDEISFLVDLVAGESQLGEGRCAGTRSTDDPATYVIVPDRIADRRSAQHCDELYLVAAAEEYSARPCDGPGDAAVHRIFARLDDRKHHFAGVGSEKISFPVLRASAHVLRRGRYARDGAALSPARELDECAERVACGRAGAPDEYERPRANDRCDSFCLR